MPSDLRLSNKIKPLDMMLSSGPGSNSTQPSGTNRLSQNPSINGNKSSDLIKLSRDPSTISTKSSDPKKKLSHDPSITSTKSLDSKNKLSSSNRTVNSDLTNTANSPALRDTLALGPDLFTEDSSNMQSELEQLSNVSLPSYQRQSSMTRKVDIFHTLSSINFTSDIEHLKQSIVLKSILSKNLQHLSDELFSKSEVSTNTEPSGRMQDRVFEKVQDINSWFSPKDILNSQTLLSPVIKSVPQDLLPEGGPGTSSDIEHISDRLLEAVETHFPMNRKSSFKTKHLVSEVPASNPGSNGSACDCVVKQILSTPMLSQLETGMTPSEAQMALQDQLFTSWERCVSSQILNYGEKGKAVPLSHPKTGVSKIMQSFPVETLLENGIIKVIELDKENQSSLLNMQTASHKENLQNPTEQHSNVKNQTKLLARQNTPTSNPTDTFVCGADYTEDRQGMSAQESKYPTADKKSDLPNEHQSLDTEEAGPSSTSETLSSLLGRLKDPDKVMLKSCLKNIFNVFKSERKEHPEKEFDRLIQHSSPHGTEHLEKNQENFNKADKEDRKHILDPKLCVFLEKLSESEVKNMKSELGKHIQHYIIEKLSEAGHITKEDLTNIYQNLYQMNEKEEKEELKEQSPFQDKYSETVKEIMSFVNNFNHHFIDKHLEIKLRSFLNEILQNYFLKNLSENNLLNETDGVALCPSVPSLRNKSTQGSLHGLMQDISSGSFGSRLKINMNYPLNESLQNNLKVVSENELLSIKADLSEYFQVLFKDKLHKSELMTERQLKGINEQVNSITSPPTPLKHIKTDLSFRDESYFMREDLEEQIKYSKIGQNATLQIYLEEAELARKQEKGSAFSHNLKENPPTIWDHKHVYSREVKALNVIKVQSPNKNIKANLLNKSPERPSDLLLKKHKKDHGFMQLPQAENSVYKTETQEPYSWDGRSKTIQSKPFFEKTLKVRPLDKRENNNNCKLTAQEKPDTGFSPYLKLPTCKMSRENEHLNRLSFPTWRANTLIYVNPESGEQSKLDQYCQRWKGSNNNNKKHLVTFAQFKNEMENLYINPYEACNEKCAKISDSQSFKHKGNEKNSRPFFFPEVLKKENMKSTRKESDYAVKSKKSLHKIVRILPATLPPTRPHLRKSVPRTLLHWTARKTIHDCLDRYEDLQIPPVKPPKNSKSRARLLGKSPDDSNNRVKHCARPYTAPEPNKRRESIPGKFASPRMVSAGLVHIHDTTTPEYEIRKIRSKRKLKENIEKRPLICDIIRMIDTAE
ncbi:Amyotrophic lateral sclerosis 2 chromosomal region candidate gene 11 protein [Cricetulus griseus]|uniref:Amyotrophic lateral sclerosis 2 chromosomal region candidate gene 11 protein n=2 Tax=Cricetulus griseus TaxID=10029 RepID=G3HUJ4_CRIGR|nr:Amyotrophic lateral sclerosis 2 chromosomal region candidate gene 11 protein [Cricetulus griseus]